MRHWILACRLRHCARAKSLFLCQRIAIIDSRNTRRMQSRGIPEKNKNTVHEKKPPSGKRKRSHTSSLFFLWGHEFPSFSPIFQKRDRLRRRRRREQRRIRNGHHHREIPRHRDHRWGRTSPFVAVFPSLFLGCVTLHERRARISPFSSSIQGGQ